MFKSIKPLDSAWTIALQRFSLALMVGYCFLAILYGSDFAEIHISVSCLDFPIFLGEIIGFIVAMVFIVLIVTKSLVLKKPLAFWGLLFAALAIYVPLGYWHWGALTFRNAALYYYIYYAFFVMCFASSIQWTTFIKSLAFGVICLTLFLTLSEHGGYFLYSLMALAACLIFYFKDRRCRLGLSVILLLFARPDLLFSGPRTNLVASCVAIIFLLAVIYRIKFPKFKFKHVFVLCGILLMLYGVMWFKADRNGIISIVTPQIMFTQFQQLDNSIKNVPYKPSPLPVRLYSKNVSAEPKTQLQFNVAKNAASQQKENKEQAVAQDLQASNQTVTEAQRAPESVEPKTIEQHKDLSKNNETSKSKKKYKKSTPQDQNVTLLKSVAVEGKDKNEASLSQEQQASFKPAQEQSIKNENTVAPRASDPNMPQYRDIMDAYGNALFRLFIWRDMVVEVIEDKAVFGVGLGKPQRSISLEKLGWGSTAWQNDGWITPHNSLLHIVYRTGILGLALIGFLAISFVTMLKGFMHRKDYIGVILLSTLLYWVVAAQFLLILELPYFAIPFWCLVGAVCAYAQQSAIKPSQR